MDDLSETLCAATAYKTPHLLRPPQRYSLTDTRNLFGMIGTSWERHLILMCQHCGRQMTITSRLSKAE